MTNAEAIETLRANYPDACYEQLREAVDAAIEVLKAQDAAGDTISRQAAIDIERNATVDTNPSHFEAHQKFTQFMNDAEISSFGRWQWSNGFNTALTAVGIDLKKLPSAQPDITDEQAIGHLQASGWMQSHDKQMYEMGLKERLADDSDSYDALLPPTQPEKEIPKRVLWNGWKGMRDTRYKCPNCKKPVRNTDIYCHRCGQKLMFPNIDFTPYVEGKKQELIVRWDDEE